MNPMHSAWAIRKFLLGQPRANRIRVTHEGGTEELAPARKSWTKTAETLHALQPESIHLLDQDGKVIRAMRMDDGESVSDRAPDAPEVISADPETARLTHLANLVARAYEHSTEIAFGKLIELVERMGERSDAIEARLERQEAYNRRLERERVEDAYDRADELVARAVEQASQDDPQSQMALAFLQSAMNGKSAAPNGNGQHKPTTNGKG